MIVTTDGEEKKSSVSSPFPLPLPSSLHPPHPKRVREGGEGQQESANKRILSFFPSSIHPPHPPPLHPPPPPRPPFDSDSTSVSLDRHLACRLPKSAVHSLLSMGYDWPTAAAALRLAEGDGEVAQKLLENLAIFVRPPTAEEFQFQLRDFDETMRREIEMEGVQIKREEKEEELDVVQVKREEKEEGTNINVNQRILSSAPPSSFFFSSSSYSSNAAVVRRWDLSTFQSSSSSLARQREEGSGQSSANGGEEGKEGKEGKERNEGEEEDRLMREKKRRVVLESRLKEMEEANNRLRQQREDLERELQRFRSISSPSTSPSSSSSSSSSSSCSSPSTSSPSTSLPPSAVLHPGLQYFQQVKFRCQNHPRLYESFLSILNEFSEGKISSDEVRHRVRQLFSVFGHIDLIQAFERSFSASRLKQSSTSPSSSSSPSSSVFPPLPPPSSVDYVELIKQRFPTQPEILHQMLDCVKQFRAHNLSYDEIMQQAQKLLRGHPDLINGFLSFFRPPLPALPPLLPPLLSPLLPAACCCLCNKQATSYHHLPSHLRPLHGGVGDVDRSRGGGVLQICDGCMDSPVKEAFLPFSDFPSPLPSQFSSAFHALYMEIQQTVGGERAYATGLLHRLYHLGEGTVMALHMHQRMEQKWKESEEASEEEEKKRLIEPPVPPCSGTVIATITHKALSPGFLSFSKGDAICVCERAGRMIWRGYIIGKEHEQGLILCTHTTPLPPIQKAPETLADQSESVDFPESDLPTLSAVRCCLCNKQATSYHHLPSHLRPLHGGVGDVDRSRGGGVLQICDGCMDSPVKEAFLPFSDFPSPLPSQFSSAFHALYMEIQQTVGGERAYATGLLHRLYHLGEGTVMALHMHQRMEQKWKRCRRDSEDSEAEEKMHVAFSSTAAQPLGKVIATIDHKASLPGFLSFSKGEKIAVCRREGRMRWRGFVVGKEDEEGLVVSTHTTPLPSMQMRPPGCRLCNQQIRVAWRVNGQILSYLNFLFPSGLCYQCYCKRKEELSVQSTVDEHSLMRREDTSQPTVMRWGEREVGRISMQDVEQAMGRIWKERKKEEQRVREEKERKEREDAASTCCLCNRVVKELHPVPWFFRIWLRGDMEEPRVCQDCITSSGHAEEVNR